MKVLAQSLLQINRVPVGGWSEGMIWDISASNAADAVQGAFDQTQRFLQDRMFIAGKDTVAIGVRATPLEIVGVRPVVKYFDPPIGYSGTTETDASFVSVEVLAVGSTGKRRVFRFAGTADARVVNGKFDVGVFGSNFRNMLRAIQSTFIRGVDRTQPEVLISTIDRVAGPPASGTVVTSEPHGLVRGDLAQLLRVRNSNGKRLSGVYSVVNVADTYTFSISPWSEPTQVQSSGTVRKYVVSYDPITTASLKGIVARKIGRPFGLSRARKFSKKTK